CRELGLHLRAKLAVLALLLVLVRFENAHLFLLLWCADWTAIAGVELSLANPLSRPRGCRAVVLVLVPGAGSRRLPAGISLHPGVRRGRTVAGRCGCDRRCRHRCWLESWRRF